MFNYGADLSWRPPGEPTKRLWLCKRCHLARTLDDAKLINTTTHIMTHLLTRHKINVRKDGEPSVDQQRVPGSSDALGHSVWEEDKLQSAWLDWAIVQDQSFANAVSPELRSLMTWNRAQLLPAIPKSHTTLSNYIQMTLKDRKDEIRRLLQSSVSKISFSADIWTSPNHLNFLGVVAHFIGSYFIRNVRQR